MATTAPVRWYLRSRSGAGAAALAAAQFTPADFAEPLKTGLLILQPTPFCNIDCDYCYLPQRDSNARMSLATVRLAAQRLRADGLLGDALTVVWHAGEPLAMPPAFYEAAFGVIDEELGHLTKLQHAMQTNAMLIDDAWCALLRRHGVRVGVSVDGPADLHDAHRRTRSGHGTHATVLRGMARLRAHGIAHHAIAVVTDATLARAEEFIDFFVEQQVSELGCNFDEAEGGHAASSLAGREDAHRAFIERLLERSMASPQALRIRELAEAYRLIAEPLPQVRWRGEASPDNAQTRPFALLSVAHNGDFSTFSPELLGQHAPGYDDFVIGNVARSGYLDAAAASPAFARLWHAVREGVRACERGCAHFAYCGGGAPANKFYENGDIASAETLYCRSMVKRPFDAVLARLEHAMADADANVQEPEYQP